MRQKSILSFIRNPKPSKPIVVDEDEIAGIDTPPEKEQRHRSVFSTIMHKFSKPNAADDSASESSRLEVEDTSVLQFPSLKCDRQRAICGAYMPTTQLNGQEKDSSCRTMDSQENKDFSSYCENDILRPETPGARPLIPRLKRVQETCDFENKSEEFSHPDNRKRSKLLQDSDALVTNEYVNSETTTKFEWLLPSKIKDCNGRNPRDPLYDKKTLYIPPEALRKMSASQKQYWDVKRHYMDVVVFFKVGKFYELYELDAEIGHKELDWKITLSGVGKCRQVGVSESGIDDAVQKLVARGYKVGRIEQLETSEQAKSRGATSVIQRKLLNVFTPATTSEGNIGPDAVHLLSIKEGGQLEDGSTAFGFAFVDCAALKFWVGSVSDDASCSALRTLLVQVSPKEIIYETLGLTKVAQKVLKEYNLTGSLSSQLSPSDAFGEALEIKTRIESNSYFSGSCNSWTHIVNGVVHCDLALCALGGVVNHLSRLKLNDVIRNGDILSYEVYRGFLRMDGQTLVNLEIFNNNADGSSSGTLFKYLDNCLTSSGKRLLRNWICHPLQDVEKINNRLTVVGDLIGNPDIMIYISRSLRKLPDLERLLARVRSIYLSSSVLLLPSVGRRLLKQRVKIFGSLIRGMRTGIEVLMLLQSDKVIISSLSKVVSLPMLTGRQGLDEFLAQFEAAMDSDFPSFQDHNVTDSDDETLSALIELFVEKAIQWSQIIHALNCIDVLRSFAVSATSSCGKMCRPVVLPKPASVNSCAGMSPTLLMKGLWHPYALGENEELPVPNDIHLGDGNGLIPQALLLTGPNMGGKSTLLRATCLAVVMAQLGCYVPCETCTLSVADIIFTRLGASDRIMTGQSTFLVECSETASVLQNATKNSLVLLDELGRGTSTFDGYAIAYAVFRHLVESINCRLLFATHYQSLTKEFASHPLVKLQHMACSFDSSPSHNNQRLIFLYRLSPGACPESYGMHVALMAGIPSTVVERASKAAQVMKKTVGDSFKSCEQRENFSTLHDQWLKELLNVANVDDNDDDDALDSLFCLWHELQRDQAM